MAESWDDATFFSRMGVQMPRTGPVGVPNAGGLAATAPRSVRPAVVQQPPVNGPAGAPSGPVNPVSPATGAPSEMTLKFHAPEPPPEPPEPPEPVENPLGTPVMGPDGASNMLLNPAGKEAYAGERLRAEELFGPHPFSGDPMAPRPNLTPGKPAFNPFFGWS